jgi:hypothetical protein
MEPIYDALQNKIRNLEVSIIELCKYISELEERLQLTNTKNMYKCKICKSPRRLIDFLDMSDYKIHDICRYCRIDLNI